MPMPPLPSPPALARGVVALALAALLAGCGGGGGDPGTGSPASCSEGDQKSWLADYMGDWYFWYRLSPRPDPAGPETLDAYFGALLYTGTDPAFPADRWSFTESTETFNRFFGDGQALGYGVSVAGVEVTGRPDQPLYVRYVEARSDAAAKGVVRGDEVVSMNGRAASDVIAADDYSALTPSAAGQTLTLVLRNGGAERTVTLTSGVFTLTPVSATAIVTSPLGRRLGYVVVKDMIGQALAPLDAAFASFRASGIDDVVLDLRYNGGGLVSTGAGVASYLGGIRGSGQPYATLLYNDRHVGSNQSYAFTAPASGVDLPRVFVLIGPRTCSASEQVINGLRGIGIDVVAIGDTTCGKPVGFLPTSNCGTTYSVVNFESVNARNEGRYFDGFAASCPVAEDFSKPLGSPAEPLLAAARGYADTGSCPAGLQTPLRAGRETPRRVPFIDDGGGRPRMLAR